MNTKFFNKLIKSHLLREFPGYITSKRGDLFRSPMNHLWRGFSFSPSSTPDWFYVTVTITPLYMPMDFFCVGIGERLRSGPTDVWVWQEERGLSIINVL